MDSLYRGLVDLLRELSNSEVCVVQIVGPKDSGKTLVISEVIRRIRSVSSSIRIAVVKHSHHRRIDIEGKDTYRFLDAGADIAFIGVQDEYAFFSRREDPSLLIKCMKPDIVLIEGFRDEIIGFRVDLESFSVEESIERVYGYIASKCLRKSLRI
ncbi:MAG: molybdopterin-guanine dinucleotide biosynthesis protein B [Sulfolobales archaeon]